MLTNLKTAIILAGGKSSRMGFDKIDIPYQNQRLLDYQVAFLKPLFQDIIVVSNTLSDYKDQEIKIVHDAFKETGPLAGLHTALKNAKPGYAYLLACDMPFLNEAYIRALDQKAGEALAPVIACEVQGFIDPFHGAYRTDLVPLIETMINEGGKPGLVNLIKKAGYRIMNGYTDESMFVNLNSPADLKNYLGFDVNDNGKEELSHQTVKK